MKKYLSPLSLIAVLALAPSPSWSGTPGVTDDEIVLGSVLALQGEAKGLGQGMRAGLERSIDGEKVGRRTIRILFENDAYEPVLTRFKTNRLVKKGIFLMVGNVGTPTAKVSLPVLKQAGSPAVGFFTGAGLLRPGAGGPILNYRASYVQETAAVIDAAIRAGLKPEQVCAYVQNDAFGKAGVVGVQTALERSSAPQVLLEGLATLLAESEGGTLVKAETNTTPINENGPVGVYQRNTKDVEPGYQALKQWETKTGYSCGLIVTVGAYNNIAQFVKKARDEGESWIFSAVSFTGAVPFAGKLEKLGVTDNIVMSQVVPLLDSKRPIVGEAQAALGDEFGFVSLEGYVVGRMLLTLLRETPEPLTGDSFMQHARGAKLDLEGLAIDFTGNGYQASNLVEMSHLTPTGFQAVDNTVWNTMLSWKP